ncbi:MAG: UDP-N-acetylmuramoyl-L-alanyl-D-glutamate--2,6-diaminopimelate ligase [Actinomycetota bacterium]|nr:UDP-N-acetylmuramoyl-L-alanyl-D-glutamate--2,6-diaminopimelate ligase [Actinomycetota bacterium]
MRLSSLLSALPRDLEPTAYVRSSPDVDPVIRGVSYDSRKVSPGDLFVAVRGAVSDGHEFIDRALEQGAAAVLVEEAPAAPMLGACPAVVVPDTRRALAPIARLFFGDPASELTLVGITGTNGKTSTTYLVESILAAADQRVGLIGTVDIRYAGETIPSVNTTPESLDLQRTLRNMRTAQIEAVVMEVSSHGLELGRVAGCRFRVAAFTNLTQDHLDFHGDMDAYGESKAKLFSDHVVPGGTAVVNVDDPSAGRFMEAARAGGARVLRCSRQSDTAAEVRLLDSEIELSGSRVRLALPSGELTVELPLVGDFNLENLIVACGVAEAVGTPPEAIAAGVAACPQVPGRMEVVRVDKPGAPVVIVDYAHTPDAVDKLLAAVRPLCSGRMITVFGCGGDRDRAKRPLMAEAVARHSDVAIATSDNPRTESPTAILEDVVAGLGSMRECELKELGEGENEYAVVEDRRAAIMTAVRAAHSADTVVIAGKGHEDYQIVGREKLPFDDREEARRALGLRTQP